MVRALQGRFLAVRLELFGDGQAGPQIAALRAYGPRFSYRDRYLPELYRETADGAAVGPPSGPDFLDRFLALFESVLTPLEDQVAASWRLTAPNAAPAEALDWLAGWIGLSLEPGLAEHQRRRMIRQATALYRRRGTLAGLAGMLDVVTDDGVRRGELVIVEQFRLRRTLATILGADLADEDDPLTRGVAISGNSYSVAPSIWAPKSSANFWRCSAPRPSRGRRKRGRWQSCSTASPTGRPCWCIARPTKICCA